MTTGSSFLSSTFGLHGKTLLVTGASSGIGRQVALDCARAGATIIVSGRDGSRLSEVLQALSDGPHRMVVADLATDDGIEQLGIEAGPIDGMVFCAGISALAPMRMVNRSHIQNQLNTNLIAPMLLTRQLSARNHLREGGSIVFMSSISAHIGVPGVAAYASTKAALEGMARSLSMELARKNIRVNCLAPGLVQTPMFDAAVATTGGLEATVAKYPLGIGTPEDIGAASIFFMAPASRWITGTVLVMDGGHSVG